MAQQNRILVIDDERKMTESMQKLLSNEGYAVDTAHGARKGIALLETGSSHPAMEWTWKCTRTTCNYYTF